MRKRETAQSLEGSERVRSSCVLLPATIAGPCWLPSVFDFRSAETRQLLRLPFALQLLGPTHVQASATSFYFSGSRMSGKRETDNGVYGYVRIGA